MFEAVQFIEPVFVPGEPGGEPVETILGAFATDVKAVECARAARRDFEPESANQGAWWLVREQGATVALWIADHRSPQEYVLDLTTRELVPYE